MSLSDHRYTLHRHRGGESAHLRVGGAVMRVQDIQRPSVRMQRPNGIALSRSQLTNRAETLPHRLVPLLCPIQPALHLTQLRVHRQHGALCVVLRPHRAPVRVHCAVVLVQVPRTGASRLVAMGEAVLAPDVEGELKQVASEM